MVEHRGFVTPALRLAFCGFVAMQRRKAYQTPFGFWEGFERKLQQQKTKDRRMAVFCFWWTIKGSNLGPAGYEPAALTNWANGPYS